MTFSYSGDWFANAITTHSAVERADVLPNGHVAIVRAKADPVIVAAINSELVEVADVDSIAADGAPTVICLIQKDGHYLWAARDFAESHGSSVQTMAELYSSLNDKNPRPFVSKNVAFARQLLDNHTNVASAQMICEALINLDRVGDLTTVCVAVEYEYEFSQEAFVAALQRHPDATVVLNSNPNGKPTAAALRHAFQSGVPLFGAAELMGALNLDGDDLRNYRPPAKGR